MKKIFLICGFSVFAGTTLFAQTAKNTPVTPPVAKPAPVPSVVKFNELTYNFGQVVYNSDCRHVFEFKNVSDAPVAVKDVGTSCGCTTPSYSKEPVAPGKTGSVTAKYDSSRLGAFTKTLTVYINSEAIRLTIMGTVLAPQSEPQPKTK
jgi:hypothetical protein